MGVVTSKAIPPEDLPADTIFLEAITLLDRKIRILLHHYKTNENQIHAYLIKKTPEGMTPEILEELIEVCKVPVFQVIRTDR